MEENNVLVVDHDGVLIICASCNSIRDDNGNWNPYISEHSEAVLSHGICPGCTKELYPEYLS